MISEIAPSVWCIEAPEPGPTVAIFGGIHGNERAGVEVVNELRERFSRGATTLTSGRLTLALGNLDAIAQNVRGTGGRDLNRCFTAACENVLEGASYEERRAAVLAPFIREADITLDLHATNKPSAPFLCSLLTPVHDRIARWFETDIVLADPNFVLSGVSCTTDDYAGACGKIGICYEAGWVGDTSRVPFTVEAVLRILGQEGLVTPSSATPPPAASQRYMLTQAVLLTEVGFTFNPGMGTHTFQPVTANTCIGLVGNVPFCPSEDSVIVFPKVPELWAIGKPVFYLAKGI